MELKDVMIQEEERLEAYKQSINKIINECSIAEAYLQSKNIFKNIYMIAETKEDDQLRILGWEHSSNHKAFKIMYIIEDEITGEIISKKCFLECPLHIRTKLHPFLGDFIMHIANQVDKKCDRGSNGK